MPITAATTTTSRSATSATGMTSRRWRGFTPSSLEASSSARCIVGTPFEVVELHPAGHARPRARPRPGSPGRPAAGASRPPRPTPRSAPSPCRSSRPARSSRPPGSPRAPAFSSSRRSAAQPRIDAWWQCGCATTSTPASRRQRQVEPLQQLGERQHVEVRAGELGTSLRSVARQDGSSPTTGTPRLDVRRQRPHRAGHDRAGLVQLAGGHPGEPAAGVVADHPRGDADRRRGTGSRPARSPGRKWSVNESAQIHTSGITSSRAPADGPSARSVFGANAGSAAAGRCRRSPWPAARPGRAASSGSPAGATGAASRGPPRQPAEQRSGCAAARAWPSYVWCSASALYVAMSTPVGQSRRAALAGQAEVERLVHGRVAEPLHQRAVERLLEHPRPAAGGVLLVAGGEVRRAHHAAGRRRHALADAGAAVHRVAEPRRGSSASDRGRVGRRGRRRAARGRRCCRG